MTLIFSLRKAERTQMIGEDEFEVKYCIRR